MKLVNSEVLFGLNYGPIVISHRAHDTGWPKPHL